MADFKELKLAAEDIRNAKRYHENTAEKVGGLLSDMVDAIEEAAESGGGDTPAPVVKTTAKHPIVVKRAIPQRPKDGMCYYFSKGARFRVGAEWEEAGEPLPGNKYMQAKFREQDSYGHKILYDTEKNPCIVWINNPEGKYWWEDEEIIIEHGYGLKDVNVNIYETASPFLHIEKGQVFCDKPAPALHYDRTQGADFFADLSKIIAHNDVRHMTYLRWQSNSSDNYIRGGGKGIRMKKRLRKKVKKSKSLQEGTIRAIHRGKKSRIINKFFFNFKPEGLGHKKGVAHEDNKAFATVYGRRVTTPTQR